MKELVRELCALSVFCGLALSLAPEGGVRRVMAFGCALVLLLPVVTAVKSFDYGSYALELARYRDMGRALSEDAAAQREKLDRFAAERACAAYLGELAASLGAADLSADVRVRWDTGGFWVPERAALRGSCTPEQKKALSGRIAAELGLDGSRQDWEAVETG